ncbi:helix-turn-helix domain-containing protein [Streptomyces sp. SHP 1-2]|uniref:helix-turn-helix domain-containing protein n=1 Tax=Streptomyces sp. SHP 1-2 TaxID=2769489 RepID=UPI0022375F24|nr:PucR family transcriptional regulator [Streptomyces sp. SHP 1-2]MCW5251798.1 helix-turn-helix domain-containing protein [Streptomyces sp. SHP 1-2]
MSASVGPQGPPASPVSLADLLARDELGLRRLAGPPAAGVALHGAHASEMADPGPYLLGGELLLTAGVWVPSSEDVGAACARYVARVVAAGGAALGFGVTPVHDEVPEALVAACAERGLPLVEVPPGTTFSGVARAVGRLMTRAGLAEVRRVAEAQRSLAVAASRPDPVSAVLRRLASLLDGRAVLYSPEGVPLASAGRGPAPGAGADGARRPGRAADEAETAETAEMAKTPGTGDAAGRTAGRPGSHGASGPASDGSGDGGADGDGEDGGDAVGRALATLVRRVADGAVSTASDGVAGARLAAYGLGAGQGGVLGVVVPGRGPGSVAAPRREPGDHALASVAAVLLSLLTGPAGERFGGTGGASSSALVRLLLGARPEEVAPLLDGGADGDWYVVHARADAGDAGPVPAAALGAALGTSLVDPAGEVVRLLVPARGAGRQGAGRQGPPAARDTGTGDAAEPDPSGATASSGTPAPSGAPGTPGTPGTPAAPGAPEGPSARPGWTLGVSAPVTARDWAAGDVQAGRALARARAARTAVVRHTQRTGLAGLVPDDEAEAYARALLAPLEAFPTLVETLRAWLSLHGSWDRTAVALSVHRNTVRQRVARCAALLGADLDDMDVRTELWFALRRR